MRNALAWLILTVGLLTATVSTADQSDPRLEELFQSLLAAPDAGAAKDIESQIWRIWAETGDAETDKAFEFGTQAMALGDYRTALAVFMTMTRDTPDFAEGWNKLATVEYLLGNYQSSIQSIDRTLALEPRHFGALAGLGLVNMELEREEAALTHSNACSPSSQASARASADRPPASQGKAI
jgi:tetratricopeptide (TPR) repeat protein